MPSDASADPKTRRKQRLSLVRPKGGGWKDTRVERWPPIVEADKEECLITRHTGTQAASRAPPKAPSNTHSQPLYPVPCEYPFWCCHPYVCYYSRHFECGPGGKGEEQEPEPEAQKGPPSKAPNGHAEKPERPCPEPEVRSSRRSGARSARSTKRVYESSSSDSFEEEANESAPNAGASKSSSKTHFHARTISVKVHYCYRCGRFRSQRFHDANPLMPGKQPIVDLCTSCQHKAAYKTAWGPASGRIVGERVVFDVIHTRGSRKSREAATSLRTAKSGRSQARKQSSRVIELSSSSEGSQAFSDRREKEEGEKAAANSSKAGKSFSLKFISSE